MKKHITLGLVASTLFLAGCCTTHHATKYEYKVVNTLTTANSLADQGWSVVAFTGMASGPDEFLLKRAKP
ncbi:MAG: hypothetical protein ACLP7I_00265 [Limisphaerales bacterium]